MVLEDMNSLLIGFNNMPYPDGSHPHPVARRLRYERVVAIEVYMLCPQHGGLFQGPDVERFASWVSEPQADTQPIKQMEHEHGPGHIRMGLEFAALVKGSNKFIRRYGGGGDDSRSDP